MPLPFVKHWMGNRRMRRAARKRLLAAKRPTPRFFRPTLELLEDRTLLSVTWISTQSGFWDVGSNWSTGKAPTASDDVTINQPGVTVTVRDAEAAGTLSGSDALTIASGGALNIANASTFGGDVSVASGGTLSAAASTTLSGNLSNAGVLTVQAGKLTVSGTVGQVSGTSLTGGNWNVDNGATLDLSSASNLTTNAATVSLSGTGVFTQLASITTDSGSLSLVNGANFSAGGDFTISGSLSDDTGQFSLNNHQLTISSGGTLSVGNASGLSGVSQMNNAGAFQLLAGTGTMSFGTFNNQGGTIDVESGNLALGAGTDTGGNFVVSQGATIQFAQNQQGAPLFTGTYTGSGAGQVQFNSGGLLIGNGGATFDFPKGLFVWTGGSFSNSFVVATLTNTGFFTIDSSSGVTLGSPLVNQGAIDDTGTGNLFLNASLDNQTGGTFVLASSGGLSGGTFSNEGTLKMTGSGTASLNVGLNLNGGTVEADSGNLVLSGGTSTGGNFVANQGATIQLAQGNQGAAVLTGSYTGSGAGQVQFNSGSIVIGKGGATFDFAQRLFQWTGGSFSNAFVVATLTNTGFLSINDTSSTVTLSAPLVNKGEIDVMGTQGMGMDAAVDNQAGAVFNIASAYGIGTGTGSTLSDEGTLKMTGSGTATLTVPVDVNRGTVEVDSGDLVFSGSAGTGTATDGNFVIGQGAILDLSNYNNTPFSGSSFAVAAGGTVNLGSGTYSGSFTGAGTVNFTNMTLGVGGIVANVGNFDWTGGLISTALGDLTNRGTMTLSGTNEHDLFNDGTLDNYGTLVQTGTGNLGLHSDNQFPTTLKIEPGASYLIEADSGVDNPFGEQTAIINDGTIRKTAGTGTSTLLANGTFSNTGTIKADSGTLSLSGTIPQVAGNALVGGTWNALNGSTLALPSGTNIATNQANLTLDGKGASITGIQNLSANSGDLSLTNGASLTTAGNFDNTGNLVVGVGSTLAVNGGYTQSSTGTLQFQLGALRPAAISAS